MEKQAVNVAGGPRKHQLLEFFVGAVEYGHRLYLMWRPEQYCAL